MPLQAAIFDLDGVIIDSSAFHFQAWQLLAQELGLAMTEEAFRETFGLPNRLILPKWLGRDLEETEMQQLSDRKEALFRQIARGQLQPLPGVMELIRALHERGFRLAIASSTPRENRDMIAADLGLWAYFPVILCGDDVRRGKPAPDVFLAAAERLGVPPPRCVVLEDAVGGVQAARAAGMKCLAITTTQPRERLGQADRVVDSWEEVTVEQIEALLADP